MKKLILAALAVVTMSSNAHAFGLVNIMTTGRLDFVGSPRTPGDLAATVVCIALLPLCLLDEKADNVNVTRQDLLDNGYSKSEVNSILVGQSATVNYLKSQNKALVREGNLSREDIAGFLRGINGVTEDYVQFFLAN